MQKRKRITITIRAMNGKVIKGNLIRNWKTNAHEWIWELKMLNPHLRSNKSTIITTDNRRHEVVSIRTQNAASARLARCIFVYIKMKNYPSRTKFTRGGDACHLCELGEIRPSDYQTALNSFFKGNLKYVGFNNFVEN